MTSVSTPLGILNDDINELDEFFMAFLTNPSDGSISGSQGEARADISDDDGRQMCCISLAINFPL